MMTKRKPETDSAKSPLPMMRLDQTILLRPDEQFAFWHSLQAPVKLTLAQRKLGVLIRGEG